MDILFILKINVLCVLGYIFYPDWMAFWLKITTEIFFSANFIRCILNIIKLFFFIKNVNLWFILLFTIQKGEFEHFGHVLL